jgi:hypothetical protein
LHAVFVEEKTGLSQEAARCVVIDEVFFHESEGLAFAWALGDTSEGRAFFGFTLAVFGETRTSVQTKAGPIENGCCASELGLQIVEGSGGDATVEVIEKCESERLLLFLWLRPCTRGSY